MCDWSMVRLERCVDGSNRRSDSTVSPMNSMRIGSSSPGGKTSTMPPRTQNSPTVPLSRVSPVSRRGAAARYRRRAANRSSPAPAVRGGPVSAGAPPLMPRPRASRRRPAPPMWWRGPTPPGGVAPGRDTDRPRGMAAAAPPTAAPHRPVPRGRRGRTGYRPGVYRHPCRSGRRRRGRARAHCWHAPRCTEPVRCLTGPTRCPARDRARRAWRPSERAREAKGTLRTPSAAKTTCWRFRRTRQAI